MSKEKATAESQQQSPDVPRSFNRKEAEEIRDASFARSKAEAPLGFWPEGLAREHRNKYFAGKVKFLERIGDCFWKENLPMLRQFLAEHEAFMQETYQNFLHDQQAALCPHGLRPEACDDCLSLAYRKESARGM